MKSHLAELIAFLGAWFVFASASLAADDPAIDYEAKVKPILAARCYACHGALKQEGDLRLDSVAFMKGEHGGPIVVLAGDAAASPLIERVSLSDPESRMPPGEEGAPLTPQEIDLIKRWIDAGAIPPAHDAPEEDPADHWAFRSVTRPALPEATTGSTHPIDLFLNQAHQERGLRVASPAEPAILLRRVYLDLIGVPPSEEQTAAFVADPSSAHYEAIVDQLLADPRHSERWARHWMDIWRYSDWWGLGAEVRNSQKHIWHWRDWIIDSLEQDLGYDQMVRLMLAADEIAPSDPQSLRASGYLARQYFKFNRDTWLDETIEHTSKAFMGLTLNCSRCHDHKYDPFTTYDYYRLRAVFEPYQVRTDLVPGRTGVEEDGIPRAFDCNLQAPTYRYIRGDAKRPLTDEPLTAAFPELFSFASYEITPVELPVEAHQPGVQPWVVEAYLNQARQAVAQRESEVQQAEQALLAAREREAAASEQQPAAQTGGENVVAGQPLASDSFMQLDAAVWRPLSGEWIATEQGLEQRSEIADRSMLELIPQVPNDFDATLVYTIQGGSMWRSVGIVFDATADREILAYASAYAGGQKVQLAFKNTGDYQYPNNAMKPLSITVPQTVTLRVRCQGDLVNVDVDGQPALAWRSAIGRAAGALRLITFDAQARFEKFELRALDLSEPMRSAESDAPRMPSVAEASLALDIAKQQLATAQLMPELIEARAAAERAKWDSQIDPTVRDQAITNAARLERTREWLEAMIKVFEAQRERAALVATQAATVDEAMLKPLDEKIAATEAAAQAAHARIETPGADYQALRGSYKTVESPTETADTLNAPFPTTSTGRRTALAQWLTDPRHPLTARVAVNHIWTRHFGAPLVPTIFDFGRKGAKPTHPELLDWLASEFMERGWSMRELHRLMVTSDAYKRSSSALGSELSQQIDPENRTLWRMNTIRIESQVVRDSLLSLAGQLDLTRGGPSIPLDQADQSRRRSLYFVHSHNEHHRFLATFDDAPVQECYRREVSIVPQQALALSNSRIVIEASQAIARRLSSATDREPVDEDSINNDEQFVRRAFGNLLATEPSEQEMQLCLNAMQSWKGLGGEGMNGIWHARSMLVLSLVNHNDFVTVR